MRRRAVADELARVRRLLAIVPDLSPEALTEVKDGWRLAPNQNRKCGRTAVSQPWFQAISTAALHLSCIRHRLELIHEGWK